MKKLFWATLLFVVVFTTTNAQQIKDGFKGFEWGTDISLMRDTFELILEDSIEQVKDTSDHEYSYSTNIKNIGSAEITCTFTFYKNKFYSVYIVAEGISNYVKLKAAMDEAYGKPLQFNQFIEKFNYFSQKTGRVLDWSSINDRTKIIMWSRIIMEEKKKDDKAKAEKAKSDF